MKVKNWLYPVLLGVSVLAVFIAILLPLYHYVYNCGLLKNVILGSYGVFTNFAGLDLFSTYIGITGTFASSYLILGFIGLLLAGVLTILKMTGFEIQKFHLCNKIATGVALVGTIGFVVSAILFVCINYANLGIEIYPDAYRAVVGAFPLWLAMSGLILGTIASFLGARDIAEDEATRTPQKLSRPQTTPPQKPQTEPAGEVFIETNAVIPAATTTAKKRKAKPKTKTSTKKTSTKSSAKTTTKTATKTTKKTTNTKK